LNTAPRRVRIDNVSFSYPDGNSVLHHVSAEVRPGEVVAFLGASGSGKSTVLNLLPRFYDPQEGGISLDAYDLRLLKTRDVRSHFAVMSQDNILMLGSVRDNIAYGKPNATDAEINRVIRLVGAEFIYDLEGGLHARVAHNG